MRTPPESAKPDSCGASAREAGAMASATAMSGGGACGKRVYGLGRERLAAQAPVAALDLVDDDPGHAAHVLALDLNHGVGQALDHRTLLLVVENALDHLHIDHRHRFCSLGSWSFDRPNSNATFATCQVPPNPPSTGARCEVRRRATASSRRRGRC